MTPDEPITGTYISNGELRRTLKIIARVGGEIIVDERTDDETYITVGAPEGVRATACLTAPQLWNLGEAIVALFDGKALRYEDKRLNHSALRSKLFDVLFDNEARCLDDNIDREVVLNALMKALQA